MPLTDVQSYLHPAPPTHVHLDHTATDSPFASLQPDRRCTPISNALGFQMHSDRRCTRATPTLLEQRRPRPTLLLASSTGCSCVIICVFMRKIARSRRDHHSNFVSDAEGAQLHGIGTAAHRSGISQELIDALPRIAWAETAQCKRINGDAVKVTPEPSAAAVEVASLSGGVRSGEQGLGSAKVGSAAPPTSEAEGCSVAERTPISRLVLDNNAKLEGDLKLRDVPDDETTGDGEVCSVHRRFWPPRHPC